MCLGIPLQVRALLPSGAARCSGRGVDPEPRTVEVSLLDAAPRIGDWLLVHVDIAVRALDPHRQ